MLNCIIVGIGGFIGTVCRYLIGLIPVEEAGGFPFKTFAINIIGCFVIGVITAFALQDEDLDPQMVLLIKVGICGGFTTFSSFAYESMGLMENGQTPMALLYICSSVVLGILAVFAAQMLVQSVGR